MKQKKPKVLVLFSGGLDSRLAVKILQEQAEVECINFILPFGEGCCNEHCSLNFCQKESVKLNVIDCTKGSLLEEYLNLIKKPKYGYGSGMNPCIDCRIFLLKKAREFADKGNIEIIATGEVLNERPMSQHKKALEVIETEAGLRGRLLRPLSAKLLKETEAEKKSILNRNKFLDIQGRNRKRQIELAKKYRISYPNPAGGCLLCEKEFCKRLQPVLEKLNEKNIRLIKLGRHFQNSEIILGRNQKENEIIEKSNGIIIVPKQPGPSAVISDKKYLKKAEGLIQKYSKYKIESFEIIQ